MSFERKFPTLHNYETKACGLDDDGKNLYCQKDIDLCCLDKEKVRKVWAKHYADDEISNKAYSEICKELGL